MFKNHFFRVQGSRVVLLVLNCLHYCPHNENFQELLRGWYFRTGMGHVVASILTGSAVGRRWYSALHVWVGIVSVSLTTLIYTSVMAPLMEKSTDQVSEGVHLFQGHPFVQQYLPKPLYYSLQSHG